MQFFWTRENKSTRKLVRLRYEKEVSDFEDKINKVDKKFRMLVTWLRKQILMLGLLK